MRTLDYSIFIKESTEELLALERAHATASVRIAFG